MFLETIQPLIAQHGYWVVFLVIMLESAGVPLPGESALVLAAVYAGATGQLDITYVIATAIAAATIGDNCGFWIGRIYGVQLLERYGRYVNLTESRLRVGRYLFERHGAKIVFFGRFVAVLRVFAAVLAGVNKYGWKPFLFFNAAGAVTWATLMGLGGYVFGESINRVSGALGIAALVIALIGIIAFIYFMRQQEKRLEMQLETAAEAEYGKASQAAEPGE
ncbi:DedA family protein [Methyloferula stellata]|uniref:DedA family protein n=1 Tax=Methyloferula stellata TaxID=876270 RepID=UPI00037A0A7F|nr:DedA family protein [Methyloferula stellata]